MRVIKVFYSPINKYSPEFCLVVRTMLQFDIIVILFQLISSYFRFGFRPAR